MQSCMPYASSCLGIPEQVPCWLAGAIIIFTFAQNRLRHVGAVSALASHVDIKTSLPYTVRSSEEETLEECIENVEVGHGLRPRRYGPHKEANLHLSSILCFHLHFILLVFDFCFFNFLIFVYFSMVFL